MGTHTPPSTDGNQGDDKRQQENSNPDRPPIDPSDPDAPDPFDPFETEMIADGGVITQDPIESTFEAGLDAVLPEPTSPPSPTPEPQPTTTADVDPEPNTEPGTESELDHQEHAPAKEDGAAAPLIDPSQDAPYDPAPPAAGSLIADVEEFLSTLTPEWAYELQSSNTGDGIEHHAVTTESPVYSLQKMVGEFCVFNNEEKPRYRDESDPAEYNTFERAMAAFVEGVDWGVLPPGGSDPRIWEYSGYAGNSESFQSYLSGSDRMECGDHYFANTSADYGIHIASYRDQRSDAPAGQTITVLTVQDAAAPDEGVPIYRGRFPGQKHAFDFLLTALADGLSQKIALHDGERGDPIHVPPIRVLTGQS